MPDPDVDALDVLSEIGIAGRAGDHRADAVEPQDADEAVDLSAELLPPELQAGNAVSIARKDPLVKLARGKSIQ